MVIASDEEFACVKLVESYVQSAIGRFDIDPKPELRQSEVQYHVWQGGDLLAFFTIKATEVQIWPWSPYRFRHFICFNSEKSKILREGSPKSFSLADPDSSKVIKFIAALRCDCGRTRHQGH